MSQEERYELDCRLYTVRYKRSALVSLGTKGSTKKLDLSVFSGILLDKRLKSRLCCRQRENTAKLYSESEEIDLFIIIILGNCGTLDYL